MEKELNYSKELSDLAKQIQEECHQHCQSMASLTKASYQDVTNVWIFKKLAELQLQINKLSNK